jgi:hypothetical protein
MLHARSLLDKKTGRKINSPPGLKFGIVTPKDFEVVNQAMGLNASFSSSLIFSLLLFSF